jgi:hypothetical protein
VRELRKESPGCGVNEQDVRDAFSRFDELWTTLAPREQMQVIRLLVNRVEWDPRKEQIRIVFAPTGITGLVEQTKQQQQEAA